MPTQKRRAKTISILVVPEDKSEPYSFRIKTNIVKVLYVLGVLLVIHIVAGAVFYWKYANLHAYNKSLLTQNHQLREDNKRVIELAQQFNALEQDMRKVRNLLGVDRNTLAQAGLDVNKYEPSLLADRIVPAAKTEVPPPFRLAAANSHHYLMPAKNRSRTLPENIPSLLPVKGFLTQDFQSDGWFSPRTHSGIDIVAKKGTVIRAAGAGAVIFANWTYDLGNLIIIDHGGGILSYYGHNQRILVPERSYVKKGEPIALLGSSGKSSGPHLHFEIWKDGVPVDPKEFILAFSENITAN